MGTEGNLMDNGRSLNPIEAFLIGLEIEIAGVDLYTHGQATAPTLEIRNLFSELIRFEQDHIKVFQNLIREKQENAEFLRPYDQDEAVEYIGLLTKSDVFRQLKEAHPKTVRETLMLAADAEKNAVLLYTEMKNISRDPETADVFERLLREEKQHFILLSGLLEKEMDR
jgi:rubrerythrin